MKRIHRINRHRKNKEIIRAQSMFWFVASLLCIGGLAYAIPRISTAYVSFAKGSPTPDRWCNGICAYIPGIPSCKTSCAKTMQGSQDCYQFCQTGNPAADRGCLLTCRTKIDPRGEACKSTYCASVPKQGRGICTTGCYDVTVGKQNCAAFCDPASPIIKRYGVNSCLDLCKKFPTPKPTATPTPTGTLSGSPTPTPTGKTTCDPNVCMGVLHPAPRARCMAICEKINRGVMTCPSACDNTADFHARCLREICGQ